MECGKRDRPLGRNTGTLSDHAGVIDGLAGLVKCKTKDKLGLRCQEPES